MKRYLPITPILIVLTILAAGCGGPLSSEITPESILENAVVYMCSLAGFEFQTSHTGPAVYLDADNLVQFVDAVGHYVSPDKALTKVNISVMGMVTEITVISLEDVQWGSNPLSGAYQELDSAYLFKPTQYFDPTAGFFPSLGSGTYELVIVGEEELEEMPGVTLTHLSGIIPGAMISEISNDLIIVESMIADMWVDTTTNQVHRVVLTDQAGEGEGYSTWQFNFWNFGATVEISAP
jgi:hypothetical protein